MWGAIEHSAVQHSETPTGQARTSGDELPWQQEPKERKGHGP